MIAPATALLPSASISVPLSVKAPADTLNPTIETAVSFDVTTETARAPGAASAATVTVATASDALLTASDCTATPAPKLATLPSPKCVANAPLPCPVSTTCRVWPCSAVAGERPVISAIVAATRTVAPVLLTLPLTRCTASKLGLGIGSTTSVSAFVSPGDPCTTSVTVIVTACTALVAVPSETRRSTG